MQFDGEWTSQSKRTEALFRCILKKVKGLEEQGKSKEAQEVIEKHWQNSWKRNST